MLRFPAAGPSVPATYVFPTERQCSVFRAISADKPPPSPQVNGNAPFFGAFYGVSGNFERICSVFQAVFKPFSDPKVNGINRYKWVGMLRFRHNTLCLYLSAVQFLNKIFTNIYQCFCNSPILFYHAEW